MVITAEMVINRAPGKHSVTGTVTCRGLDTDGTVRSTKLVLVRYSDLSVILILDVHYIHQNDAYVVYSINVNPYHVPFPLVLRDSSFHWKGPNLR